MPPNPANVLDDLLQQREWIARLARQLCRDEHAAEDSVQSVFAQAVQHPPRHDQNLRGWLARLLRHTLGMQRRANARRIKREAVVATLARDQHEEATIDAVARAEAHRHLVDRILSLSEPQRGLVLRHYFEEASVADLAAQSTLTPDAVRAHLRRAREQLRGDLAQSSSEQQRGLALLAGFGAQPFAASVSVAVMGMIMTTKLAIAVVAAGGVLLWWSPWTEIATPTPVAGHDTASSYADKHAGDVDQRSALASETPQPSRQAQLLPTERLPVVLQGQLVGLLPDVPWQSSIRVRAKGKVDAGWLEHGDNLLPADDGSLAFELPAWAMSAESLELRFSPVEDDPNYDSKTITFDSHAIDQHEPLLLPVSIIARLCGRVVDDSGRGVAAAKLCAFRNEQGLPKGKLIASCSSDADGYYTLRSPIAGDLALLAVPMQLPKPHGPELTMSSRSIADGGQARADILPRAVLTTATFAEKRNVANHHLPQATSVVVRVLLPEGIPASQARIRAHPLAARVRVQVAQDLSIVLWDLDRAAVAPNQVTMDCTGPLPTASLALPAGVSVNLWPRLADDKVLQLIEQPSTIAIAPQAVDLAMTGSLRTLAVRGGGQAVVAALVMNDGDGPRFVALTDEEGQCKLLLPATGSAFTVQAKNFATHREDLGASQSHANPIVVELSPDPSVVVQIHCTGGPAISKMELRYQTVGTSIIHQCPVTKDEAAADLFSCRLPTGRHELFLRAHSTAAPASGFLIALRRDIDLPPEGLRFDWPVEIGGRIQVEVRDANGLRRDWRGALLRGEHVVTQIGPRASRAAVSENVEAGAYMLRTTMTDGRQQLTPVQVQAHQQASVRVELR